MTTPQHRRVHRSSPPVHLPPANPVKRTVLDIVDPDSHGRGKRDPGVEANARLTATTGLLLLVMLAAEGVTLLSIHGLLSWHVGIGLALIPPVLLKVGSTGWRFARYYLGDLRYRASGPPHPLLRVLGPFVILSTLAVLGTGVGLWLQGPGSAFGFWHRATFVLWLVFMTIHVVAHVWRAVRLAGTDVGTRRARRAARPGPGVRQVTVFGAMAAGVVVAFAARGLEGLGPWVQYHHFFR